MAEENEHTWPECPPPPECPEGIPAWMATFADLVTLLLTFFVLLYAMSKTDETKFESVAGSIRKAFAGNAMKIGETVQLGKSPDDSPTMLESQQPVEPFPIDLLTSEGLLDKKEYNRESEEDLEQMKQVLKDNQLDESVEIFEMKEGIKVRVKDKIYFNQGSTIMANKDIIPVYKRIIKLMKDNKWTIFIEGYADFNETWNENKSVGPFGLSSQRAEEVAKSLIARGVEKEKITVVVYGDTRAKQNSLNRKVEFVLRKRDLRTQGKKVNAQ